MKFIYTLATIGFSDDILECFRTKNKNQAVSYLMKGLTAQIASPHTFSLSISENPIGLKKRGRKIYVTAPPYSAVKLL